MKEEQRELLNVNHHPHPLDTYEGNKIVLAVHHYFAEHYPDPIAIPDVSQNLRISLVHIETAFDRHKGLTATQALLEYRLNRLCDQMHRDPSEDIAAQINNCGLGSGLTAFGRTDRQFIACFGIDLIAYHQQCFLAAASRLEQQDDRVGTRNDELVGAVPRENRLMTRFPQPGASG
jgi:AraC-like DNA-binding protein